MPELTQNEPVVTLLSWKKNSVCSKDSVIAFGRRKGKTGNRSELYLNFVMNLTNFRDKQALFTGNMEEKNCSNGRLPWLYIFLFDLDEVGLN